jgi:cellulose biosynthesis protein BcsQ
MSDVSTAALVGATGGAGTTRTVVELAAALAADDHDVAVLDAAYATQGLADYVPGRIDPDVTRLVTDDRDAPLAAGLVDLDLDLPGRVACLPARAPFERLARAKTAGAARSLEDRIDEAAARFDVVLVDVPPVAANQAAAAVTACDRTALVAPATTRGADAVQSMAARLDDVGTDVDAVVSTRGELNDADASVPETDAAAVDDAPACLDDADLAAGVADVADALLGVAVSEPEGGLLDSLRVR